MNKVQNIQRIFYLFSIMNQPLFFFLSENNIKFFERRTKSGGKRSLFHYIFHQLFYRISRINLRNLTPTDDCKCKAIHKQMLYNFIIFHNTGFTNLFHKSCIIAVKIIHHFRQIYPRKKKKWRRSNGLFFYKKKYIVEQRWNKCLIYLICTFF